MPDEHLVGKSRENFSIVKPIGGKGSLPLPCVSSEVFEVIEVAEDYESHWSGKNKYWGMNAVKPVAEEGHLSNGIKQSITILVLLTRAV